VPFEVVLPIVETFGLAPATWGLLLIINPILVTLFQLRLTSAVARYSPALRLGVGLALMGFPFLLLLGSGALAVLIVVLVLFVVGEMLWIPTSQALAARLAPATMRGAYMGAFGASSAVAWTVAPLVALQLRRVPARRRCGCSSPLPRSPRPPQAWPPIAPMSGRPTRTNADFVFARSRGRPSLDAPPTRNGPIPLMPHIHEQIDFTVEVFCVHAGRVLLRRHDKFGIWLGVGGHVELDEDPDEAAHREVREEVGLEIELIGKTAVPKDPRVVDYRQLVPPAFAHRHRVSADHEHVVLTYFACALSDKVVAGGTDVSDEWRWVSGDELDDPALDLRANVRFYAEQALASAAGA